MREILFKGAQKVDGSKSLIWYEGSLIIETDGYTGEKEYYIQNENGSYLVIPETVGQYTGLPDKNGKKIFEGDILEVDVENVKYTDPPDIHIKLFSVIFNKDNACFMKQRIINGLLYPFAKCYIYKVIGNIYDNPELLKEADDE